MLYWYFVRLLRHSPYTFFCLTHHTPMSSPLHFLPTFSPPRLLLRHTHPRRSSRLPSSLRVAWSSVALHSARQQHRRTNALLPGPTPPRPRRLPRMDMPTRGITPMTEDWAGHPSRPLEVMASLMCSGREWRQGKRCKCRWNTTHPQVLPQDMAQVPVIPTLDTARSNSPILPSPRLPRRRETTTEKLSLTT